MYESAIYDWYLSSHWEAQLIHIPTFVFCYCNKTVTTFTTVKGFFPPNSCCKWFRPFQIWIDNQSYVTVVAYYQLSCMSLQVLGCGSTLPRLPWHDHTEHDTLHVRNRIGLECKRMIAWHELFLDIRLVSKVWRMKDTVAMSTWLRRFVASTVTPQMTMIGTQQVTQHDCVGRNGPPWSQCTPGIVGCF